MRKYSVIAIILCAISGCALINPIPPQPIASDLDALLRDRRNAVWNQSGLDDSARPSVVVGATLSQFQAGKAFSRCMEVLGWPDYRSSDVGYSYRAIQLATTDPERFDWYVCFAAYPVDSTDSLQSRAQYNYVYDYFQDTLIPCLRSHGYEIRDAPDRFEFRTTWFDWSDPLFPYVWNPYYAVPEYTGPGSLEVAQQCPANPPGQDFYALT